MRYLNQGEVDEVKRLRAKRVLIKDIAQTFLVCEATVSNIINGKHAPRKIKIIGAPIRSPYDPLDFKEEDFSALPDNVLFQHAKERDFIG